MNKIQTKIIKYIKIHQNTAKTEIYRIRRNESRVRSKSRGHFNTREILQFDSLTQNLIVSELLTRVPTVIVKSLVMSRLQHRKFVTNIVLARMPTGISDLF